MDYHPPLKVNVPAELLRLGYTLLRRLGAGSTSEVYEARHNATQRRVAIKVSRADVPEAALIVSRMQTEWNVGRGLRHPHLVTILDGGTFSDGRAWLVMERLVGHDLEDELTSAGHLEPARAVHIMRQVCEALEVVHRRGAVHRDVKPENVFLSADGRYADHVKLIDLGILALPEDDPERQHEPTGHFILGTPLYLAPEQACGQPPDARTDLYAVGGVLYHMLSGRPPFEGDDPTEMVAKHVNDPVERLDALVPDLPPSLVALVHRCLEKDREDRPASAAEVMAALDACARDLAGEFSDSASLRRAPLPEIPMLGHQGEWTRFAENLEHLVGMFWAREAPSEVRRALRQLGDRRRALHAAQADAQSLREAADVAARHRIERRERLQRRQRRVAAGMERVRARLRDLSAAADEAAAAVDAQDDRYAQVLDHLRTLAGATVAETPVRGLVKRQRDVEALLEARAELVEALAEARRAERDAAAALAELGAEEIDLQREFADQELEEQEDGFINEQAAAAAVDARTTAQRAFEQAAVRLMLAYAAALSQE